MISKDFERGQFPDSPGIYIFRDYRKRPLYIGRATSLQGRIRSYLASDLIVTRGPRIVDMVTRAKAVTWQKTNSVLEAILLESELIKKYQPSCNVDERDDKSSQYVVITDELWPRVFLARARDLDHAVKERTLEYEILKTFGPYREGNVIKEALKILRKLFPFKDKKSFDPRHDAFYRSIGRSPGGQDTLAHEMYMRTIEYLIFFFEGKQKKLQKELQKQMKVCISELRFEDASEIKRLLYAVSHINDMALIKRENLHYDGDFRIEAYDVAHTSGVNAVGVMVVSSRGEITSSEHRKFNLLRSSNDDNAGLKEILSRRLNHTEWNFPDLIVVDGNEVQMKTAEGVLAARRITIPVVAVTKDDKHKAARLIGHPDLIKTYKNQIIAINAEAHRFAISFHRNKMRKGML